MFQKPRCRPVADCRSRVTVWAQASGLPAGSEMGGDLGRLRTRTVSVRKSLGSARLEVCFRESCRGRDRSVVQVDCETRLVGRSGAASGSRTRSARNRSPSMRVSSALPRGRKHRQGTNRPVSFGGRRSVKIPPGASSYSDASRFDTARRRADRWPQAGRVVSRYGPERADDLAREGAADLVSQPPALRGARAPKTMTQRSFHDDIVVLP